MSFIEKYKKWIAWSLVSVMILTALGSSIVAIVVSSRKHYHQYKDDLVEATCTQFGYTKHTCEGCGNTYIDTIVSPTGHSYGVWVSNDDGTHTHTCTNDESHTETNDCEYETTITEPTCTEQGYTTHTCKVCGYTYCDDYVSETGHDFVDGVCTKCEAVETENDD